MIQNLIQLIKYLKDFKHFGATEGLFWNETKKHSRTNTKITIGYEN